MTATMPQRADLRNCRLYRFFVEHPVTGEEVLGYVGETVRSPFERLMEHVDVQPWIDTVTRWERDPRVFAGKRAVLDAEAEAIRDEKPLYNVIGNERNRDRVIPPDAIRQRRARDAAVGAGRWVHPDDRALGAVRAPRVPAPASKRPWKPWQKQLLGWGSGWLTSALAGWVALVWWQDFTLWWCPPVISGTATGLIVMWLLAGAPISRRQRRRAWRKLQGKRR